MHLSRPRLWLRAALLLVLAGFMAWRGLDTRAEASAPGVAPDGALWLGRIAVLEWILAGLAVVTAGVVLSALRSGKPRQRLLKLRDGEGPGREPQEEPPGSHPT